MDKTEEIELLKQALDEIPRLRARHFRNGEFPQWQSKVLRLLESVYGRDSIEYRRFVNAPGTTFRVRTEEGQRQDYDWRLDCYEEALRTLVK